MALKQMELAAAILDIVPHLDAEVATIRIIMQKLAEHFGVDFETIRKQKAMIKQLVVSSYEVEPERDSSADKENQNQQHTHERDIAADAAIAVAVVVKKRAQRSNVISDESDEDNGSDHASDEDAVEERGSSENESDSGSDAPRKPAKRVRAPKKSTPAPVKKKQRVSADSPGFTALKELARAARLLSPRVYAYLKKLESEQEQEEHVRGLLKRHGIRFNGRYPQKREIESVRRKTDMARDLEGIDTSLIIDEDTSKRPRRASRSTSVSYRDQLVNRSESDEDANGDDDDDESGEDKKQAKRKADGGRARKRRASAQDDESDAGEANDSESSSSEAEF